MENLFKQLIAASGDDITRDGLIDTPKRAAQAFKELTQGYSANLDTIINNALFASDCDEIVAVRNIELFSLCEHHLLPFIGSCQIAYIPRGKILGLSKFARVVDHFARRLQVQESLTRDIANALREITGSPDVAVIIDAKHLCMMMRGVEKQQSSMVTSVMYGCFRNEAETRNEVLRLLCP